MSPPITNIAELDAILANQRRLGKRIMWLLLLPFVVTIVVVWMFHNLSARLADVEIGTKLVTIERYVGVDKNYPAAIDEYEKIAKTDGRAAILARLGVLYFLLDPKENEQIALEKLNAATRADPGNWEAHRNLTFIYLATDRIKDALESGQKALQLNENDANTYSNLAWIHATSPEFGDLGKAQKYAEKAVKLTKERQSSFLDTLAEVYFRQGDRERALASLHKAKAAADDPDGAIQEIEVHFRKLFPDNTL